MDVFEQIQKCCLATGMTISSTTIDALKVYFEMSRRRAHVDAAAVVANDIRRLLEVVVLVENRIEEVERTLAHVTNPGQSELRLDLDIRSSHGQFTKLRRQLALHLGDLPRPHRRGKRAQSPTKNDAD